MEFANGSIGDTGARQDEDASRISLIVVAYNAASTLGAALWSVVAQSRPPYEVIVVDDGSTDATREVTESFTGVLPIRLVAEPVNRGVGLARRTGCDASTGDTLTFVDSDDLLFPDHLERLSEIYTGSGCIAAARYGRWRPGRELSFVTDERAPNLPEAGKQRLGILRGAFILPASLFSAADYRAVEGFRDLRAAEDWDVWIQLIHSGARVVRTSVPTMLYRRRDGQLTSQDPLATVRCDLEVLEHHEPRLTGRERRIGRKMIRRRRARAKLIAGQRAAAAGERLRAIRCWWQAAFLDRDFRRVGPGYDSSVAAAAVARILGLDDDAAETTRPVEAVTPARIGDAVVTVVVLCDDVGGARDGGQRLRATLASIASQTVPIDELVVVVEPDSNGWPPTATAVVDRLSSRCSVRTVRSRDHIWHTGVEATAPRVFAFVREGDFWLPEHLEMLLAVWSPDNVAIGRWLHRQEGADAPTPEHASVFHLPIMLSSDVYQRLSDSSSGGTIRVTCHQATVLAGCHVRGSSRSPSSDASGH